MRNTALISKHGGFCFLCDITAGCKHQLSLPVSVLPSLIDRLGDAKDQVREQDQALLLKIMDQAANPQVHSLFILSPFSHLWSQEIHLSRNMFNYHQHLLNLSASRELIFHSNNCFARYNNLMVVLTYNIWCHNSANYREKRRHRRNFAIRHLNSNLKSQKSKLV